MDVDFVKLVHVPMNAFVLAWSPVDQLLAHFAPRPNRVSGFERPLCFWGGNQTDELPVMRALGPLRVEKTRFVGRPLHENSQEYFLFVTPFGVYSSERVIMGTTDAVAHCQGAVTTVAWLDDLLGHAKSKSEAELLEILRQVLERCEKFGLKLYPGKCQSFRTSVVWCGRQISEDVVPCVGGGRADQGVASHLACREPVRTFQ